MDPALAGVDIRGWYGAPPAARWDAYQSAGWRPIRLATRGVWALLGLAVAGGALRAAGRSLLALPRVLLAPLRFVILFVFRPELEAGTSHGSARWAGPGTRLALRLRRSRAQLALGRAWVGPLPLTLGVPEAEQFAHTLLVAPPNAGKTSRVLIPNLLRECLGRRWPGPPAGPRERLRRAWLGRWRNLGRRPPPPRSFVATDPKGELVRRTGRAAARTHDVLLLDLLHPERGHRYNPLAHVRGSLDAHLVAEAWVANTGKGKDTFWETLSKGMIANGLLLLARRRPLPPLYALRDLLCQGTPEEVLTLFERSGIREVADGAASLRQDMADNERMKGAAFADLQNRLQVLIHDEIRAATAADELDLAAFGARPTALYLRYDQNYAELLAPLTAAFYAQLFDTLMRQATADPSGRLAVPVVCYLEEFGNIGTLPGIHHKMAQLRGYGVGFWLVLQNLGQLADLYGGAAGAIVGACWTRLCLAGVGTEDGAAFSKLAGDLTVLAASQGEGRAITRVPWADSGNWGRMEAGRPLITADELRTMGTKLFAVVGRRRPLLVRTLPYYRDPLLRGLARLGDGTDPLVADFARADWPPPAAAPAPRGGVPASDQARRGGSAAAAAAGGAPPRPRQARITPQAKAKAARRATGDAGPPAAGAAPTAVVAPASAPGAPRLSPSQRALLDALVAATGAGDAPTIAALGRRAGLKESTARNALRDLRTALGVGPGDDLLAAARARGLVAAAPAADVAD